ncbi:MAG: hypothetical protein VSS75_000910 [Candidatus Parabeggiatoa sp.]|nr:hypothetical protein [Candidatus Parabeggiatoa sp.]
MGWVSGTHFLCIDDESVVGLDSFKLMLRGQADNAAIELLYQEANWHRCLYKPWNIKELIDTIQSALAKL